MKKQLQPGMKNHTNMVVFSYLTAGQLSPEDPHAITQRRTAASV